MQTSKNTVRIYSERGSLWPSPCLFCGGCALPGTSAPGALAPLWPSPCSFGGTGLPMRQRVLRQGLCHCWLGSLPLQHLGPLRLHGVEDLHLAEVLPASRAIFMRSSTSSGVKVGWPSLPFCTRSLCLSSDSSRDLICGADSESSMSSPSVRSASG